MTALVRGNPAFGGDFRRQFSLGVDVSIASYRVAQREELSRNTCMKVQLYLWVMSGTLAHLPTRRGTRLPLLLNMHNRGEGQRGEGGDYERNYAWGFQGLFFLSGEHDVAPCFVTIGNPIFLAFKVQRLENQDLAS